MNDKPKTQEEWMEYVDQKYKVKVFSVSEVDNERKKLEQKYGHERILSGKYEDMITDEEKMEWIEYKVLTNNLYNVAPDLKKVDELFKDGFKAQKLHDLIFSRGKKIFLVILGILSILLLIIYILH